MSRFTFIFQGILITLSFLMTNSIKCPYSKDIQEQVSCLKTLSHKRSIKCPTMLDNRNQVECLRKLTDDDYNPYKKSIHYKPEGAPLTDEDIDWITKEKIDF